MAEIKGKSDKPAKRGGLWRITALMSAFISWKWTRNDSDGKRMGKILRAQDKKAQQTA